MSDSEQNNDYRNMSAAENEECMPFLLARDGYKCNLCRRTIELLNELREIEELNTGRIYKTKVIVIDHINNNSKIRDSEDGKYCGNLQILCWSCNRRKGGLQRVEARMTSKETSMEKGDYIDGLPSLINWATAYLIENEQGCYRQMIYAATKQANGLNPVTNERYFNTEIYTEENQKGRFEIFPFNCGSRLCKGEHIILKGYKPTKLIEKERYDLLNEWKKQYGESKEEYTRNQTMYDMHKPWITFDEFVVSKGKLLNHTFSDKPR